MTGHAIPDALIPAPKRASADIVRQKGPRGGVLIRHASGHWVEIYVVAARREHVIEHVLLPDAPGRWVDTGIFRPALGQKASRTLQRR